MITEMHIQRKKILFSIFVLFLFGIIAAQTASTVDETSVGSSLNKVIDFLLKYVVPPICGIIFIKGAIDFAGQNPNGVKNMLIALVALVLCLAARPIVKYVTGVSV